MTLNLETKNNKVQVWPETTAVYIYVSFPCKLCFFKSFPPCLEFTMLLTIGKCLFQARNWQKALELYEYLKSLKLTITVSTVNALLTALCKFDFFSFFLLLIITFIQVLEAVNSLCFTASALNVWLGSCSIAWKSSSF